MAFVNNNLRTIATGRPEGKQEAHETFAILHKI